MHTIVGVKSAELLDEGRELFHRVAHLLHLTQPVALGVSVAEVKERDATQALLTQTEELVDELGVEATG